MKNSRKLRFWYGVFLSIFTVALGAAYIICAANLYFTEGGYTPELASNALLIMLAPTLLYGVAAAVGYVFAVLYPLPEKPQKPSLLHSLKKLRKRIPEGAEEGNAERKLLRDFDITRFSLYTVCAVFALLAATMSVVYLADLKNFPKADVTGEVIAMLKNVFPWIGAAFLLFTGTALYEYFAAPRALAGTKRLLVLGAGSPVQKSKLSEFSERCERASAHAFPIVTLIFRLAVFALAVTFLVLGALNGGAGDVFMKAIKICTECIGLG